MARGQQRNDPREVSMRLARAIAGEPVTPPKRGRGRPADPTGTLVQRAIDNALYFLRWLVLIDTVASQKRGEPQTPFNTKNRSDGLLQQFHADCVARRHAMKETFEVPSDNDLKRKCANGVDDPMAFPLSLNTLRTEYFAKFPGKRPSAVDARSELRDY